MATLDPMVWGDSAKLETAPAAPQEQGLFSSQAVDEGSPENPLDPMIWGDTAGENQPLDPNVWGVSTEGVRPISAPEQPGVPFGQAKSVSDLPTVESPLDIPQDVLNRLGTFVSEGVEETKRGISSLDPRSPETIWQRKRPDETKLQALARYIQPLGIIGGPVDIMVSPASAVISEGLRGLSELESLARPGKPSIIRKAEDWAPLLAQLGLGGVGPARRGIMKFALGPGAETAAQKATRIAARAEKGWLPTETVLRQLESVAPSAREAGIALRTAPEETMGMSSKLRGLVGEEKLRGLKLTPTEEENLWRLSQGEEIALSPNEQAVRDLLESLYNPKTGAKPQAAATAGMRGRTLAGEEVPFTARPGFYLPQTYTPEQSEKIRNILDNLSAEAGKPVQVQRSIAMGAERPHLARSAYAKNPEAIAEAEQYIKNIPAAVFADIEDFSKTFGRVRAFGPNDEKLNDILKRIGEEVGGGVEGTALSKSLYKSIARDFGPGAAKSVGLDSLRVLEAMTKMPFSFVSNATQSFITAIVVGARNTTQAVAEVLFDAATRRELPAIVKELGIINRTVAKSLQHEISGAAPGFLQKTAGVVLKPFEWVERFNQAVAARAGQLATLRLSRKLERTGKLAPREWRWLKNSDLDVAAIQARVTAGGGGLLPQEVRRASWGLLDRTQFLARPTAMPYIMRRDPLMRLVFQMKTFAARATTAIMDEVGREVAAGNLNPAIRLLAYYPIGGELAKQVGRRLRGQEVMSPQEVWDLDTKSKVQRALHNMLYVGGLGIMTDFLSSTLRGQEAAAGYAVGPGVTDVLQEFVGLAQMGQHVLNLPEEQQKLETSRKQFQRRQLRRVPFLGPRLAERTKSLQEFLKERGRRPSALY